MSERILAPSEIDELLSIFRGGRQAAQDDAQVEPFDLEQPNRVPYGVMTALRIRHEQAARALMQEFKVLLSADVVVRVKSFEQLIFEHWLKTLSEPCCAFVVEMAPLADPAVLVVDFELAFRGIDRLLGGKGEADLAPRDLTSTETGVLSELLHPILSVHEQAWQPYMPLQARIHRPVFVPHFIRDLPDKEVVLAVTYEVEGFGGTTEIKFLMASAGLEPHLQHEPRPEIADQGHADAREKMRHALLRAPLKLKVQVGAAELTLRDLVELELGDVIILDRESDAPLELLLEGVPRAHGYLKKRGSRLFFEFASKVTDAETHATRNDGSEEAGTAVPGEDG